MDALSSGLLSCVCGSVLRIILEFALPKDGSLVAYGKYALQYGKGLPGLPSFMLIDPPSEQAAAPIWNPDKDTCPQGEGAVAGCWRGIGGRF